MALIKLKSATGRARPQYYDGILPEKMPQTTFSEIPVVWEMNTGLRPSHGFMAMPDALYNSNRQFVKLHAKFEQELANNPHAFEGLKDYQVRELMKVSANLLVKMSPDKITVQITDDGALFYTVIKNDVKVYFSHYLTATIYKMDEVLISIYEGERNVVNIAGEMSEAIQQANILLNNYHIAIPESA